MDPRYLDGIRRFEGFTPRAQWDYAQHTNGRRDALDRLDALRSRATAARCGSTWTPCRRCPSSSSAPFEQASSDGTYAQLRGTGRSAGC